MSSLLLHSVDVVALPYVILNPYLKLIVILMIMYLFSLVF